MAQDRVEIVARVRNAIKRLLNALPDNAAMDASINDELEASLAALDAALGAPQDAGEMKPRRIAAEQEAIRAYLADYEFRGDEGDRAPTEWELVLIEDAIQGLIADDDFIRAFVPAALSGAAETSLQKTQTSAPPADERETVEGWQPISTAPRGRLIDLAGPTTRYIDCYYDQICDEWRTSRPAGRLFCIPRRAVTHWREVTALPTIAQGGER